MRPGEGEAAGAAPSSQAIRALIRARHWEALDEQLRALALGEPDRGEPDLAETLALLRQPYVLRRLGDPGAAHRVLWGFEATTPRRAVRILAQRPELGLPVNDGVVERIRALRPAFQPDVLRRRLSWGLTARAYIAATGRTYGGVEGMAGGLLQVAPAPVLDRALASGRSVVLCLSHFGLSAYGVAIAAATGRPRATVIATAVPTTPGHFTIDTTAPDVAARFARLVKLLRSEARVVTIVPDGAVGEARPVPLLGAEVPIGRGAAVLAWRAKAVPVFGRSRWAGGTFLLETSPGPDPRDFADGEAFEAAFGDWYAGCLLDILLGPPEDIAPTGVAERIILSLPPEPVGPGPARRPRPRPQHQETPMTPPAAPALSDDHKRLRALLARQLWAAEAGKGLTGPERATAFDAVKTEYVARAGQVLRGLVARGVTFTVPAKAGAGADEG